jgi:hypothetical protein
LCYTTPREALLSSIFRLISVLHPSSTANFGRIFFTRGSVDPEQNEEDYYISNIHRAVDGSELFALPRACALSRVSASGDQEGNLDWWVDTFQVYAGLQGTRHADGALFLRG